ncbi:MAG: hypothetical protein ACOC24_03725, partial [Desulfovibrionales bacterium]
MAPMSKEHLTIAAITALAQILKKHGGITGRSLLGTLFLTSFFLGMSFPAEAVERLLYRDATGDKEVVYSWSV